MHDRQEYRAYQAGPSEHSKSLVRNATLTRTTHEWQKLG